MARPAARVQQKVGGFSGSVLRLARRSGPALRSATLPGQDTQSIAAHGESGYPSPASPGIRRSVDGSLPPTIGDRAWFKQ